MLISRIKIELRIWKFISSSNERSLIQNGQLLAMSNAGAQVNNIAATNDIASGINFITNTNIS